jgi:hypothetical protein
MQWGAAIMKPLRPSTLQHILNGAATASELRIDMVDERSPRWE